MIGRALAEIAHTLDSDEDADARVHRTLVLAGELVPNRRCAFLRAMPGFDRLLFVVPDASADERAKLHAELVAVLELVGDAKDIARTGSPPHLTVPLMGRDQVIGILRVEPPAGLAYDAAHLRMLTVVAAQLGAYLTMIGLRAEDARRTRELAAAHDFQQMLVGIVSHDLRTPLTVIKATASAIAAGRLDAEQTAKGLERIIRSTDRSNRIINDLLDVTHVRVAGGMSITRAPAELRTLLESAIDDVRAAHPRHDVRFATRVKRKVVAEVDADRLAQVVTNLVGNAIQYGAPGSPVTLELDARDHGVELSVHNRGRAISPALLPHLFDPFRRAQHLERSIGGGLGLGLYIVDQIVRAHDGTVSATSTDADGTTFRVTLPRSVISMAKTAAS